MSDNEQEPENRLLPSVADLEESGQGAEGGSSIYRYRDFSNVAEDEIEQQPAPETPPPSHGRGNVESSIRVQKFPVKLYAILAQKEFQNIITWMPHGRSWKVLKPNLFESLVMPLFFEYSNYHSFNRLVNAWSFRRISSGPDRGSYYHELFLRGKPHLQKYMRRLPKTHKKLPMKKEDEPDFYDMDKADPLPSLEEVPLPPNTMMMPQMRQQQGLRGAGLMQAQMAGGMGGMEGRDPLMSIPSTGMPFKDPLEGMNNMHGIQMMPGRPTIGGMNMMSNGMGGMNMMSNGMMSNGMGGMMSGMNNMGGLGMGPMMNSMNSMNGIESQMMPGMNGGEFDQFQRLRQIQQMQLFESRMGGAQMGLGNDALARMQAENAMNRRLNR